MRLRRLINIEQGLLDPPKKKIAFAVKRTRFFNKQTARND